MSILIDLNQVLIANLMQQLNQDKNQKLDEGLIRHMVLNSLRSYNKQFKSKYPNVILCCDNKHYWRKDYFPFYKSQRKHDREASGYDWGMIFDVLNKIRDELKNHSPYKVIDVDTAEADDVIAVLATKFSAPSTDRSYIQRTPNMSTSAPGSALASAT